MCTSRSVMEGTWYVTTEQSLRREKLQSNRHHQQSNIQLFTDHSVALPVARQTVSEHWREKLAYHIPWTCSHKLIGGEGAKGS